MCAPVRSGDVGCSSTTISGSHPRSVNAFTACSMTGSIGVSSCASAAGLMNGTSSPARRPSVGDALGIGRSGRCDRRRPMRPPPARRSAAASARRADGCSCRECPSTRRVRERARERDPCGASAASGGAFCTDRTSRHNAATAFRRRQRVGARCRRLRDVAHVQMVGGVIGPRRLEPGALRDTPSSSLRSGNTDGRS